MHLTSRFRVFGVAGLLFFSASVSRADGPFVVYPVVTAKIFEMGSARQKLLFNLKREERTTGDQTVINELFTDTTGAEMLKTETILKMGRFVSYHLDQKQTGDKASIEARDGKIFFETTDANGKVKKDDEKEQDGFVVPATMTNLVHDHWNDLLQGKDIEMRFGVTERRESIGFKLFKVEEKKIDGHDVIVAKMKPKSMIIAAIVDPLFFYYEKDSGRLLEFRGRTLVKQKDGDRFKDLDAETVFTYPATPGK